MPLWILEKAKEEDKEEGYTKVESRTEKKNRIKSERESNSTKKAEEILQVKGQDEYEWVNVDAVVDSGAIDTICPKDLIGGNVIRETEISRRKGKYTAANGGTITNEGESKLTGVAEDGTPIEMVSQVGDKITRMLFAVRRMKEAGNMVIFGANMKAIRKLAAADSIEENVIVSKTGKRSEIVDKDGMYVYKMKIKRKKVDDMDVGAVENDGIMCEPCFSEWVPF